MKTKSRLLKIVEHTLDVLVAGFTIYEVANVVNLAYNYVPPVEAPERYISIAIAPVVLATYVKYRILK